MLCNFTDIGKLRQLLKVSIVFSMAWKQRYSRAKGKTGEQQAVIALNTTNLQMVERIYTGWKMIRTIKRRGGQTLAWIVPQAKVSGDFRAVTPRGQSVLIEVKYHADQSFFLSQLAKHQRKALTEHHENKGLSLVIWVTDDDAYILRWPVPGLVPRKGITPAVAESLDCKFTDF